MGLLETGLEVTLRKVFEWLGNPFKRERKVSEIMTDSLDVQRLAKSVVENGKLSVYLCYLMNAFNGRKKSKGHRFKYRKFVSGFHDEVVFQNFDVDKYRKMPVDIEYSNLLDRIISEKKVVLSAWSMQSGHLMSEFIHQGYQQVGYYIVDDDYEHNEVWYLTVATISTDESEFYTPDHNFIINNLIGDLKNMIDLQRK